ncbi:hypothetical protein [Streptomyces sp. URMC 123]|uniref:hypothetical protein n=1 Tax=Streptomyces sp. URMC 123 TaxID=3423403 RepID=UPI003F1D63E0
MPRRLLALLLGIVALSAVATAPATAAEADPTKLLSSIEGFAIEGPLINNLGLPQVL